MITEDYVDFEVAELLRKKGFNERCNHCYYIENKQFDSVRNGCNSNLAQGFISAPTLQMTMKWLREVHDIHIVIKSVMKIYGETEYYYELYGTKSKNIYIIYDIFKDKTWKFYEEACQTAINYCLNNLIINEN